MWVKTLTDIAVVDNLDNRTYCVEIYFAQTSKGNSHLN